MSDERPALTSLAERAREKAEHAERARADTVEEIKERYDLLLDLRDRKIEDLEGRLAAAMRERARFRLLVVDDSESTIAIMSRYLAGLPVDLAPVTESQAAELLDSKDYDAIAIEATSSIGPNLNGLTLCKALADKGKGTKVVVMSSRPGNRVKSFAEKLGATFLRKPFSGEQLMKIVQTLLLKEKT